jgi:hypothetical protein
LLIRETEKRIRALAARRCPERISQYGIKGVMKMIAIHKEEAEALRQKYGNEVGITIVNRHKKGGRKRYFVEETSRVLYFLERLRKKQAKRGTCSD